MRMGVSDLEGMKSKHPSPKNQTVAQEQIISFSGEHDFYFSKHPKAQRENKGMDSCLLPLHW